MKSILLGGLGLVIFQVTVTSPVAPSALTSAFGNLAALVARFTDPTIPLIGSAANAQTTSTTTPAPTAAVA